MCGSCVRVFARVCVRVFLLLFEWGNNSGNDNEDTDCFYLFDVRFCKYLVCAVRRLSIYIMLL